MGVVELSWPERLESCPATLISFHSTLFDKSSLRSWVISPEVETTPCWKQPGAGTRLLLENTQARNMPRIFFTSFCLEHTLKPGALSPRLPSSAALRKTTRPCSLKPETARLEASRLGLGVVQVQASSTPLLFFQNLARGLRFSGLG